MLHNAQQFLGGPDSSFFFFQAEDGIRDFCLSRGLGDVYKRQPLDFVLLWILWAFKYCRVLVSWSCIILVLLQVHKLHLFSHQDGLIKIKNRSQFCIQNYLQRLTASYVEFKIQQRQKKKKKKKKSTLR
eukprot:TRINITY_DN1582_c0_g1_i5.p2 TRINITY_DN1582_c0_g1~~TRINITY_DN1582_c0_g1_i5.p2  ORF type:complete len:129 (-),score=29.13 TRINITY_DN1582_c0_g1_i5:5-391(-)